MFQFPRCPPPCGGVRQNGRVAPFGDRGISACTRLPHAYRSHAASFIGAQRRGILRVLIVSSLLERSTSSAFCIPAMMLLICTCQGTPPPGKSGGAPSPLKRAIRAVAGRCCGLSRRFPRKEVIQPHLPVRLPCYDFVPVAAPALGRCVREPVRRRTSGIDNSHDVTGGVYKARVRIHRAMADTRLLATPPSRGRVAAPDLHWGAVWRLATAYAGATHCRRHCSVCVAPDVRAMRT